MPRKKNDAIKPINDAIKPIEEVNPMTAPLTDEEKKIVDEIMSKSKSDKPICYNIKEVAEGVWGVVNNNGEVVRVYDPRVVEEPMKCAESYAKKLNS
jgi:hypothetical protein